MRVVDLAGKKFGTLVAISRVQNNRHGQAVWLCKCECGAIKNINSSDLVQGAHTTCGNRTIHKKGKNSSNWQGIGDMPKSIWRSVYMNARKRRVPMELTIEDLWESFLLQDGKCALSGVPITIGVLSKNRTASLDRIDCLRGYVRGNIQWVHKVVQIMKGCLSDKDFISWCSLISKNGGASVSASEIWADLSSRPQIVFRGKLPIRTETRDHMSIS